MYSDVPSRPIRVARHPIYSALASIPALCFTGTLATDIVYWKTAEIMWANFSAWLLAVGMVAGVLAVVAGLIELLGNRVLRRLGLAWLHLLGCVIVLVLSFFNALVHTRDAWTSVVPDGLILSAVVVVILLFTGTQSRAIAYRRGVGVIG